MTNLLALIVVTNFVFLTTNISQVYTLHNNYGACVATYEASQYQTNVATIVQFSNQIPRKIVWTIPGPFFETNLVPVPLPLSQPPPPMSGEPMIVPPPLPTRWEQLRYLTNISLNLRP